MTRSLFAATMGALLLSACASTPEPQIQIETRDVLVPVAVSCVPENLPAAPTYQVSKEDIVNAPTAEIRMQLLGVFALERAARLLEVEPVIAGCRQ